MIMRPPSSALNRSVAMSIHVMLALLALATLVQVAGMSDPGGGLSWFLFIRQDIAAIGVILILFIMCQSATPGGKPGKRAFALLRATPPRWMLWAGASLLVLACWAGHYFVFQGYDLSRDEQMANFDAWIFTHGRLLWELPELWRGPQAAALHQLFILPIGDHEAWVSNYLPGNAALRTLVGVVADPALTSPLAAGAAAIALWKIARRLWPDEPDNAAVAVILLATSSQVLFTAMTAYAMSAHLALNLIWLALYLADRPRYHVMAVMVGFVATGLHQPIFHPLFVAPFMLLLLRDRRWKLLCAYGASYAAIALFWLAWPLWLSAHGLHQASNPGDGIGFWDRILRIAALPGPGALWLMALNLLRLISWQHALFLPLLVVGMVRVWRERNDLERIDIQMMTCGKCRFSVTRSAAYLRYVGTGSAGDRHLQAVRAECRSAQGAVGIQFRWSRKGGFSSIGAQRTQRYVSTEAQKIALCRPIWAESPQPLGRALALGCLLPLPVLLILLPYQGHGWGYRYLHGVLGNAVLLCVFGWQYLKHEAGVRNAMVTATAATCLVLIPMHGWQTWRMAGDYATIDRAIQASPAHWAIVDDRAAPFAENLVINSPDLGTRPIRLMQSELAKVPLSRLCAQGDTTLIVGADALAPVRALFETGAHQPTETAIQSVDTRLKAAGCKIIPFAAQASRQTAG
ncbi:hypothetical protein OOT33_12810 [Sphingobium sp. DEHP117]|uniref:hypothetical protein n=1 Tax=Sphingobium sp. DEHP117 TaxID=2993436 RepID=UPI0027D57420|nr:hypothetical protein [Sphingobium sp. DEHP117]MDQ4421302.1 hypothetical protein [Sphingobium sp. DEHP117]